MVFVAESAPPAEGVKLKVTGTPALFATRSLSAMANATFVGASPKDPDGVLEESKMS